jgi:hypothetical protein
VTRVTWKQVDDMPKGAWTECHVSAPDGQVVKELKLHSRNTSGICKQGGRENVEAPESGADLSR